MLIESNNRVFMYGKIKLSDPGADMTEKEVIQYYAAQYPELTNSQFGPPEVTVDKKGISSVVFTIESVTGTKG